MQNLTATEISRRVRQIYTTGGWLRRVMIYARPYICPFEELINEVPQGSTVFDVGCGDGLFLNTLRQLARISGGLGFDVNGVAIASAREAKSNLQESRGLEFQKWSIGQRWPEGQFDVVSMIDVLHHIPVSIKSHAIDEAVGHVKPGGLFLFKDIGIKPRWRAFFNSLHDLVLTGERVTYTPLDVVVSWVESSGMREVKRRSIDRLWYGHELVVFSK